jgi:ankyrin repeat protein
VRLLLDHGADVRARRGDGRSAWLLAMRGGHEAVASELEKAGAEPEDLSPADQLMAACARGDGDAPVDAVDENGATALHNAAIRGDAAAVRELLARGADRRREDPQHHATPLGWAEFGRDEAIAPDGDYESCIRALATDG